MAKTKEKILIVEDDEFLSSLYQELLSEEGYEVKIAKEGEEGYNMAKQGGFDLILLDIMLPKLDGLQVLKKLNEDPKVKNGPVVLLTNLGQESIVKDGFQAGAAGYLIKSTLTPDQVLKEVRVFLDKDKVSEVSNS